MDPILLYFVLPLATVVFSITLEMLLNNPALVTAIVFSVFLIITFTVASTDFLIYTILYTIIALVTTFIYRFIRSIRNNISNNSSGNSSTVMQSCRRISRCQRR